MPWVLGWYRTSKLLNGRKWHHEYKGNRFDLSENESNKSLLKETHDYTYLLENGKVQKTKAIVTIVEREWRRKGWMFSSLFNVVRKRIDVQFKDEIGERTGSWKGGVLGCDYEIKPNESMLEALKRMEKNRKFN